MSHPFLLKKQFLTNPFSDHCRSRRQRKEAPFKDINFESKSPAYFRNYLTLPPSVM